jgi:hypothetical protein
VFNDAVLVEEAVLCRMVWEVCHEYGIGNALKRVIYDLSEDTIPACSFRALIEHKEVIKSVLY